MVIIAHIEQSKQLKCHKNNRKKSGIYQANFRKQCEAALFGIYDMKRKYVKHMEIFVSKLCAYDDISEKNLQLHYKNTLQQ